MTDFGFAAALVVLVLAAAAAYAVRVLVRGPFRSERLDRMGGSRLVGKGALEAAYWVLGAPTRALACAGVTANALTWAGLALGAAAAALLASGRLGIGAFVATFAGLLDALDGLLARRTGTASAAGQVLDSAIDRYGEGLLFGGLAFHYRDTAPVFLLALLALVASLTVSYATAKAEAVGVAAPRGAMRRHERLVYVIAGAGLSALLAPWLGQAHGGVPPAEWPLAAALAAVAGIGTTSAARRFAAVTRALRLRERQALGPPGTPQAANVTGG